ncbi:MAG: PorP/SprF family type IX secretion system membrane protein [Bacteroidetes bacterium]|nr:PorP/SprF family type IX secretion system membrane protein [Bacteroidota bacterium]
MIFHTNKYHYFSRNCLNRQFLIAVLFMAMVPSVIAQQSSSITHYMFMNMAYNPAFAGSSEGISVMGLVRQQWIGFKDDKGGNTAPQDLFLTVDSPLKFLHGGLGATVMSDKIAQFSNTYVTLAYAYRTDLGPGIFSAGAQVNFLNSKMDASKLSPITPISWGSDTQVGNDKQTDFIVDASAGLYYKVPDKYYVGLSCLNIAQSRMKKVHVQDKRTFDLNGGYNWTIPGHPAFELQPSAFISTDFAAYTFSVATLLLYNKKYWGGLEYRYQDALSVLVGFSIKAFRVGLSYDISISKMSRYNNGSVEVMLSYLFKIETEKFRKSYKNTRFL